MNEQAGGVWVAYHHDMGTFADAIFATEVEALRFAVGSGYLHVTFWPFGVELNDAVKAATPAPAPAPASDPAGGNRNHPTPEGEPMSTMTTDPYGPVCSYCHRAWRPDERPEDKSNHIGAHERVFRRVRLVVDVDAEWREDDPGYCESVAVLDVQNFAGTERVKVVDVEVGS